MSTSQADGTAALYPFLYADATANLAGVLDEAERSTRAKAAEIVTLREQVIRQDACKLADCATAMATRFAAGGRLYTFGNGGSSTDASEVATTFLHPPGGGTVRGARALPALSLTSDIAVVTALSNDVGFDVVFSRQIGAFGRPGDIAFGLSTSGGSQNVIRAFGEAARRGMLCVGLAGYDGGAMAELATIDYLFVIPSPSVHRVQEAQTTVYHLLWELTQRALAEMKHHPGAAG
ncbi:MAG: D-sedoheptulose-7-phosphate isomerase [Micromonosporaceae bacterium]